MMRFKSLSNSAKHVDEQLRRDYMTENTLDEWAFYLGLVAKGGKLLPTMISTEIPSCDPNHIFVPPRLDVWSNLIALSREAHNYFHANLPIGRTLSVLAKLRKASSRGDPEEIDIEELNIAAGRTEFCEKSASGMISNYSFEGNATFEKLQSECLRRLAEIEVPS